MARVLITEPLAPSANAALSAAGHEVVERVGLSPEELLEAVKGFQALIVRSATKVTAEVLDAADELIVVGRAGVGIDNIDLAAATATGVMVANAPFSIGVSTAEHAMALLLAQARNIPQAHMALVDGRWEKSQVGRRRAALARCSACSASAGSARSSPSAPTPSACG